MDRKRKEIPSRVYIPPHKRTTFQPRGEIFPESRKTAEETAKLKREYEEANPIIPTFSVSLHESEVKQLKDFHENNLPSKSHTNTAWIQVNGPNFSPSFQKQIDESMEEVKEIWKQLESSDEMITQRHIDIIAKENKILSGKWMLFVNNDEVDRIWFKILRSFHSSSLTFYAKVSTKPDNKATTQPQNDNEGGDKISAHHSDEEEINHVICIYVPDYTDEDEVMRVRDCLKSIIKQKYKLSFKPDIFSILSIYRNNKHNISPTIYTA